jgi:hypothetical protein
LKSRRVESQPGASTSSKGKTKDSLRIVVIS